MEKVALARNQNPFAFFSELGQKGYIDFHGVVVADRFDDLLREYPEFNDLGGGVDTTRIINRNSRRSDTVHIRKTQFEELRKLWNQLNRKFVLYLACDLDRSIEEALPQIIKDKHVFSLQTIQTTREELGFQAGVAYADEGAHTELTLPGRHLAYNDFLLRASRKTNITIHILHRAVCKVYTDGCQITNEMFNEGSLTRLITAIDDWKCRELSGLVRYKQANYRVKETKLTNPDGSVKDEVVQTFIGKKMVPGTPPSEYLYDAYAHDSGLELKNMQTRIEDVTVYGKIPSSSICIPTVASSNYSPDFMYLVKKADGTKELNIVIETKAYDRETHISEDEDTKIRCAEEFFKAMSEGDFKVHFCKQINSRTVKSIIDGLINE